MAFKVSIRMDKETKRDLQRTAKSNGLSVKEFLKIWSGMLLEVICA
jgi:hypothetical protein